MEIENLSNIELKQSLESLGYNCGPVTLTTRSLYEKKLANLLTESEVVQSKESFSEEIIITQKKTEVTPKTREAFEEVDSPYLKDTLSSPRSYTPDGSNLTRRPLGTPHRDTMRVSSVTKTNSSVTKTSTSGISSISSTKKNSKGILGYCKYILPVFILIAILIILVYYHMEDAAIKELGQN